MKKSLALLSVFSVGLFLLSGCATTQPPQFNVNVDSISGSDTDKKSFMLFPGNEDTQADDLQFKEYASYVNRALIKQGFIPAKSPEDANVAIFLVYGIGDPQQHQYSYSMPVWGKTGISSSTTRTTSSTTSKTTYNPTYGIKGYTTRVGSSTTYFRFLVLDALDLDAYRKTEEEVPLWKTSITSTGSSGDLRRVFPILVAASMSYISKNTGQIIAVNIRENDKKIVEI